MTSPLIFTDRAFEMAARAVEVAKKHAYPVDTLRPSR